MMMNEHGRNTQQSANKETDNKETEITLLLYANQKKISGKLVAMARIAGYELGEAELQTIHDIYFDTCDEALRQHDLALRVRRVKDHYCQLALKGKSHKRESGEIERMELEYPCSQSALERICRVLIEQGIALVARVLPADPFNAEEALKQIGFTVIQDRITQRQRQDIFAGEENKEKPIGELALDRVIYHCAGQQIQHFEIEIEGKAASAFPGLTAVATALQQQFPDSLRLWDHSKVATGRALGQVLASKPKAMPSTGGTLHPSTYDELDRLLNPG